MGIVLSAVVGAVGAVELVSVLHYISDEWLLNQLRTQNRDTLENALSKYQDEIRNSIAELGRRDSESVNYMQDGVPYENGYRQNDEPVNEELRLKFERRLKEILEESNIGAATTDEDRFVSNKFELASRSLNAESNENDCEKEEHVPPPKIKSERTSEMVQDSTDKTDVNENECEPVECVHPSQIQSDVMSESIENQFEIITPEECTVFKNVESSSINQKSSELFTTKNDLESTTESDYEILNKDKSDENDEPDSSTFPSIYFDEYDRPSQVDDDYLRTLDGVKHRPLVRDDGTGRRRAFKKRSSSSSLSQELKSSREEELKMFTSLEEAEFETMKNDFVPIKYSSEPNLASTSSSSSSSTSPNSSIKSHRHRQKYHKISDTNIADIDEENECEKVFSVDEIHSDDVTHPWGDIKPEARRDSDYFNLQKQVSIDEEPELSLDSSGNVAVCDEFEEAETKSQYQEAINVLKKQNSNENAVDNHIISPAENRITSDRNVSMDDNNFPSASVNANTPAVIAITNATTINITNNNMQAAPTSDAFAAASVAQTDKFDELTNRLQRIELAIEQKISDWSQLPHITDGAITTQNEDNDSDEEPDYSRRKKIIYPKLDYDQVEHDFQQILEDNEIDFNEDTSYLPKLKNAHHFRAHDSDEEPHFKRYNSNNDNSDASDSENIDYNDNHKGRLLRKHKKHDNRVYYESDEEPFYGRHKRPHKRKQHSLYDSDKGEPVKHKRVSDEIFDELSDTKDGVYTSTIVIGNENEFVLDSDEEPASKIENESTGALPKFYEFKEQLIATIVIPQLGIVRSYTYDSDEEPYYLEKRISLDDQSRRSAIAEANREDNIFDEDEYKQRLYDEYEIEENEGNISYCPNINNNHIYSWDSDEEPYYDEKRLITEHQRRSKSPSRSPPIRPNNENMLGMAMTQNFLDLEREIEEEDRSSRSKDRDNIIHLGLLGSTRIKTTKRYEEYTETNTETIVETTSRRKYKWEDKVASTITSYHRGELKTAPSNEGNDDVNRNDGDHMSASENDDTQKSVIEQKLDNPQSDHDSIEEIHDEEVPNGAQIISGISDGADESAVGGSDHQKETMISRTSPKINDFENVIEFKPSKEIETFDTILNHIEQETKKINDELNYLLTEELTMVDLGQDEKVVRDSSLTSSCEELRKLEVVKAKEKKKRVIKKKKKSIGEKTDDFIKLERGDQNDGTTMKPSNIAAKESNKFITTEAGHRDREDSITTIAKFDLSQVYDEFLLHEKQCNDEQAVVVTQTTTNPTNETAKHDITDTKPNKCENDSPISEQQPNSSSSSSSSEMPGTNTKRKSISRPDPLYLLKESMYPFY